MHALKVTTEFACEPPIIICSHAFLTTFFPQASYVLLTTSNDMSNKNQTGRLRARSTKLILAIGNIRTPGTFVAFHKIACNEQEALPRVLRGLGPIDGNQMN
jgi:hypothetical protein